MDDSDSEVRQPSRRKNLYYLAFFAANSLVGWIGGFHQMMPTTTFWLLHAGFAAGSDLCFVLFKFVVGHYLEVEPG